MRRALVFGVPDDRWGQVVAAALELAPGAPLAPAVAAVPALPHIPSGKLDRARAAERFGAVLAPFGVRG